jgi:ribosome-associated protein
MEAEKKSKPLDTRKQAKLAREAILEKLGVEPVILDVRTVSSVADYYVLATGRNGPHLRALAAAVRRIEAAGGVQRMRITGDAESGWIILDYTGLIVHLFTAERRSYYTLEELWNDARRVK